MNNDLLNNFLGNAKNDVLSNVILSLEKEDYDTSNIPSRKFNELNIVYKMFTEEYDSNFKANDINNGTMDFFDITEEELYEAAYSNTRRLYPERSVDINQFMDELIGEDISGGQKSGMIVTTNTKGCFGAAYMLYTDVMENICRMIEEEGKEGNLIIIPSSIHEFICIPEPEDKEEISDLVQSVNRCAVEEREILSNNLYLYDKETKEIRTYETVKKEKTPYDEMIKEDIMKYPWR